VQPFDASVVLALLHWLAGKAGEGKEAVGGPGSDGVTMIQRAEQRLMANSDMNFRGGAALLIVPS
jgi:hypothetical protein